MKFIGSLWLALPTLVFAFPSMPVPDASMLRNEGRDETHHESRQVDDTIPAALLKSAGAIVNPADKRPDGNHQFQAPGKDDSRGPCPGLNLLANYNYLPHDGHVTFAQVLSAVSYGFNLGPDLATVLSVFAVLTDGDIATESWYLGTSPTKVGGLNRHSTVEADVSPNREDYYLACGDNHDVSSRLARQNVAAATMGNTRRAQFDIAAMGLQYKQNAKFSVDNNPYLYYFPFPSIVSVVAYAFYPALFSNGTYGFGGDANYDSISSIVGFSYDKGKKAYVYQPERWPANWYRRAYPYTAVQGLAEGFGLIYPLYPIPMAFPQLANPSNLNATTILCDVYMGINSITSQGFYGGLADAGAAVAWALSKLEPAFGGTIAGCPKDALSNSSPYPSGKPYGPSQSVQKNAGNNVYNKIYFRTAPTTPQCSNSETPSAQYTYVPKK